MSMETYLLNKDIPVLCLRADVFPEGIEAAHRQLNAKLRAPRTFFGISAPNEEGVIIYKAAAEEAYPGEAAALGCEAFVICKGAYISILLSDYPNDLQSIGRAFQKLLAQPGLDPQGYCLEMYTGPAEVRCMVGLKS